MGAGTAGNMGLTNQATSSHGIQSITRPMRYQTAEYVVQADMMCNVSSQGSPISTEVDELPPAFPPSTQPQPFIPLIAPSPLIPFTNNSVPKLSVLVYTNSIYSLAYCSCWLLKVRGFRYKGRKAMAKILVAGKGGQDPKYIEMWWECNTDEFSAMVRCNNMGLYLKTRAIFSGEDSVALVLYMVLVSNMVVNLSSSVVYRAVLW
ncbi:hypothetical protein V8G54_024819 [Vigna mungo]|uniref:Uncharacterized protein n=1 Tax=Vigna mungo TaxID=3915 RepID=A0AAQ3N693_VIGMU